jgi:hypothetical protein
LCVLSCVLQVAGPMLQGIGSGAAPSAPASKYTGGFLAALSPGAEPTLAVAFEAKGGLSDVKATATAAGTGGQHSCMVLGPHGLRRTADHHLSDCARTVSRQIGVATVAV